jgi:hemolysin III
MAAIGIAYKLVFFQTPDDISAPPDRLSTFIYVLMGWTIATQIPALLQALPRNGLLLAVLGGVIYTIGGVILTTRAFDFWPGRLGHHEIWHLCVIAGAVCFYLLIYWHVLPVQTALLTG